MKGNLSSTNSNSFDSEGTLGPSRIPSFLNVGRRRSTGSPSPARLSSCLEHSVPRAVRTTNFGIPEDEDRSLRKASPSPINGMPTHGERAFLGSELHPSRTPGIASTGHVHVQTFQKLSGSGLPKALEGSALGVELQTPSLETLADTLSAYSVVLLQHSSHLSDLSDNCLQLANDTQRLEQKLRTRVSTLGCERAADRGEADRPLRASFQTHHKGVSSRASSQNETALESIRQAREACAIAQKSAQDVSLHLDSAERSFLVLSDEATIGSRSKRLSPGSTRLSSQTATSVDAALFSPGSQSTVKQMQPLSSSPEELVTPLSPPSPPLSTFGDDAQLAARSSSADRKGSEESSSSEWVHANVSTSSASEIHHPVQSHRGVTIESSHTEFQQRTMRVTSTKEGHVASLTPVWEVDSLRMTVSRASNCRTAELSSPSQADLATPGADTSIPSVRESRLGRRTGVERSDDYLPLEDSDGEVRRSPPERGSSLVIGTMSELPSAPDLRGANGVGAGVLLRSWSRKGRGLFRKRS